MLTPASENQLLSDINDAIYEALYRAVEAGELNGREVKLDPIRINKLQYLVDQELELDLTFGWFKYGPAPNDVTNGPSLSSDEQPLSGPRPNNTGTSSVPGDHPTPDTIASVLLTELDQEFTEIVTADDTKVYLVSFYETYAPEDDKAAPFTELYIESARLQQTLDELGEGTRWHANATEKYYELDSRLQRVSTELEALASLSETRPVFETYRSLLTSVVAEAVEEEPLMPDQQQFIGNLVGEFYSEVWNFVGHEISSRTMRGANASTLRQSVESKLSEFREKDWESFFDGLERRRALFRLEPPGSSGSRVKDGRTDSTASEDAIGTGDTELRESVTKLGAEVIRDDGS